MPKNDFWEKQHSKIGIFGEGQQHKIGIFRQKQQHKIGTILEKDGCVVPIEVKAGNTATVSLNKYIEQNKPSVAYKFIAGNVGLQDVKLSLPHYMILFI